MNPLAGRGSAATPLAAVMAMLVLYASLYPFEGWRWPPGQGLPALLSLPWPPWRDPIDQLLNFLGYLPLGLLAMLALRRRGLAWGLCLTGALSFAALLSYVSEVLQHLLPGRHPSLKDWAFNLLGAACGAALTRLLASLGLLGRWQQVREAWFVRRSAGALALLALWPVGLLFPAPAPWALGQFGGTLREHLAGLVDGVDWALDLHDWLAQPDTSQPLGPLAMVSVSTLGLLAPCLVAVAIARPGWRRLVLASGALLLGGLVMTLSTLLNFGPQHALAWLTPAGNLALVLGAAGALVAALLPSKLAAGLGLCVIAAQVAMVANAPWDPYFAISLQAWEQGRWVRLHGLAQWVGWLWPLMAMGWLLWRVGHRE